MIRKLKKQLDIPPAWLLLFCLLAYLLARLLPVLVMQSGLLRGAGWVLLGLGVLLMLWAVAQFLRLKTSVVPRRVPSAFVAAGPYRFSRNPIYLADALILAAVALILGAPALLILVPPFMALIQRRFILAEEAGLKQAFPAEFDAFSRQTRRWL